MNTEDFVTPPIHAINTDADAGDDMDEMVDGDRQLTTNSDAIDGGVNDSDLGTPRDRVEGMDNVEENDALL